MASCGRLSLIFTLAFASPAWAADPAPAPASAAECKDTCMLLARLSFDEVQKNICTLCGAHDPIACELDWPSSDVPACNHWDYLRNCIFARQGHVFSNPTWKAAFKKKAWYQPNPKFKPEDLPQVAKDNVARLLKYKKTKHACTDE